MFLIGFKSVQIYDLGKVISSVFYFELNFLKSLIFWAKIVYLNPWK